MNRTELALEVREVLSAERTLGAVNLLFVGEDWLRRQSSSEATPHDALAPFVEEDRLRKRGSS